MDVFCGATLYFIHVCVGGNEAPADFADLRGFSVSLADCFLFSRKFRKLRRFFYTVLIYLTRSFFEWETMGLGAGRYEIVVRKLVGKNAQSSDNYSSDSFFRGNPHF